MSVFKSVRIPHSKGGFSILEVLITAAIIGLITGLVTLRYGSFNNLILLKNQAFQIALELREMQARSLSSVGDNNNFRDSYGIHFAMATPEQYILFLDGDADGAYDSGEEIDTRSLDSRFQLSQLCNGSNCSINTLTVVFRRPNFNAVMRSNSGSVSTGYIDLETKSDANGVRRVVVNAAGQIAVE